jgi:hypothetical protein
MSTSLKNQGPGQGPPGGMGGNAGFISAGLSPRESSKHASAATQPESHVQGSPPSNHQSNLSKTVREYHLELIDTLSHVECVKCIQALGTLIINHPSLTSGTLPPHAFFGAATGTPLNHRTLYTNNTFSSYMLLYVLDMFSMLTPSIHILNVR